MSTPYRVAVNAEWTSKCNALCPMCPRDAIQHPQLMRSDTWSCILRRLDPAEVFRVVIAGYGEATTHPRFFEFIDAMRGHPVRFDMVSNGHLLTPDKLAHLDGVVELLMVSFSSIDPQVYRRVHVNLDQRRVMQNLQSAQGILRHTRLGISLTPMPECLPSLYNRGGSMTEHELASARLRALIERHGLRSQELDFVPGIAQLVSQWRRNRFKCVPRNVDLFISSSGDYLYCYNDVAHRHAIGHVETDSIHDTLRRREGMATIPSLCDQCNMRDRYRAGELARAGIGFIRSKWQSAG